MNGSNFIIPPSPDNLIRKIKQKINQNKAAKRVISRARWKDIQQKLFQSSTNQWLEKRGAPVPPPELSPQQKGEITQCFQLLDADGSGALDVDELYAAFEMLGFEVKRAAVVQLMNEMDPDGSGEIELDEFKTIMGRSLAQPSDAKSGGLMPKGSAMPFSDVARAFRRKKILENVQNGGDDRKKVIDDSDELLQQVTQENQTMQADKLQSSLSFKKSNHIKSIAQQYVQLQKEINYKFRPTGWSGINAQDQLTYQIKQHPKLKINTRAALMILDKCNKNELTQEFVPNRQLPQNFNNEEYSKIQQYQKIQDVNQLSGAKNSNLSGSLLEQNNDNDNSRIVEINGNYQQNNQSFTKNRRIRHSNSHENNNNNIINESQHSFITQQIYSNKKNSSNFCNNNYNRGKDESNKDGGLLPLLDMKVVKSQIMSKLEQGHLSMRDLQNHVKQEEINPIVSARIQKQLQDQIDQKESDFLGLPPISNNKLQKGKLKIGGKNGRQRVIAFC